MKKIFISSILITISISLFSQGLKLGIGVNPQISWLKPDISKVTNNGNKIGVGFGLNADIFFTKNYAFSTGLNIYNTGGKLKFNDTVDIHTLDSTFEIPAGSSVTYKLQYIDIPLGLKFKTKKFGYFSYYGYVGIIAQINIAAKADVDDIFSDVGISDEITFFNMGYNIGGGIEYSLGGSTALTAGLLYTNGFIDITSDENKSKDKTFINSMALRIGIIF
ncbi:MAG: PorT family protein [Bacteroidales bacterium]|nr:PorT family protein [Bacteroidales bacterium]